MKMRPLARRSEREEVIAYLHGIDGNGDLAHILVHQRGASIRFSGGLGQHNVARSNSDDLEHWIQEAEAVWGLEATIGVLRGRMTTPETLQKIDALNVTAAKKKEGLNLPTREEPSIGAH
jgi:hypothetical protein